MKIEVGIWNEKVAREITHCPSYYAADTETLTTVPGEYKVQVEYVGGYLHPMPYWVLVTIKTHRKSGRLYSGCGGLNFASTELKAGEEVGYGVQTYVYMLKDLVEAGIVTLKPGFDFMLAKLAWSEEAGAPQTWEAVKALQAA